MKKLLVYALTVIIALSAPVSAVAEDSEQYVTRSGAVEKIISTLYTTDEIEGFPLEYFYCIHESGYVHFVPDEELLSQGYPLLCEIYKATSESRFSDISFDNENMTVFISLAKEMGIISGYEDNTFRPDNLITYNEAAKMLVCAFYSGYGDAGEYPDKYIKAAEEYGITAGLNFNGSDKITSEDFDAMLKSCLDNQINSMSVFMTTFIPPETSELCTEAYAQALKGRNGALQYALYSDELKGSTRDDFEGFHWVTGVSSPWVSEYEISKEDDLTYEVIFYYATSTGPSGDISLKLKLQQTDGYYYIAEITELEYEG